MARQYLAEGLKGSIPFVPDTKSIVVESLPNGKTRARIPGRLSVCDCVNGNGRRYGKNVWEKNLQSGSSLMKSLSENAAWGLLEHPKDGQISLQSPICIRTVSAKLQEGKDENGKPVWEVVGEISILNPTLVPEAGRLLAMIEEGYCPRVSSRGFGSLVRNTSDGVDDVQDDYICEGWDVVMKPSFESAILKPATEDKTEESKTAIVPATTQISETTTDNAASGVIVTAIVTGGQPAVVTNATPGVKITTLEAEKAPTAAAPAPAKPLKEQAMNINEIKSQITSFRSQDPSKLGPQQFAEGMSSMGLLHQEIANYVAEDAKNSWKGQQLHGELSRIEGTWSETQLAPGKRASKLNEDNSKLMQVTKAVAQTAIGMKKKLGEAHKQNSRVSALLNEVTERGQNWRQRAKALESEVQKYKRRFMMASEALHQFAGKYKTDMTEMGRAHLTLEFKEKAAADAELSKLLKEATRPKALIPIRLALEGKITLETAKGILGGKISLDETLKSLKSATAQKVDESKKTAPPVAEGNNKPAAPAAGSPTAPVSEGVTIVSPKPTDPRELNEAIGMVNRLSKANAV